MNQYVFILNDKGERITSLCDNTLSRDDIMAQAEHDYPNAQYVYSADGDSMLDEFMRLEEAVLRESRTDASGYQWNREQERKR